MLRSAFKQALNNGRVYKQHLNVYDPTPAAEKAADLLVDFGQYVRPMPDCEWITFQRDERAYRGTLDTKLLQVRSTFAVTPGGAEKWGRLVSILISSFFKNGIFSATQRNGRPYGFPLLKYVARILKKFPLSVGFPVETTPDALTSWIETALCFIRERIQPALRTGTETHRQQKKVSKNKLAFLWQHRKSKAIDIILNNSCFPETPPTVSDTSNVYDYYQNKCHAVPSVSPLAPPPWYNFIDKIEPGYFPDTHNFTIEEVDAVLTSLPNNKASGSDGVIYETLRASRPTSTQTLTNIFNACLINENVPESWKGALIHRIPKKDNIPEDPSTWRDISLLPTLYKVFMKCLLNRILPWLVDTGILSPHQKAYIDRRGMNEHVFCLKTGIDDFKHESSKFYTVFLDFRDAFGTLSHEVMLKALEEIHLPQPFVNIVSSVYRGSFLQVICGQQLTEPIALEVGIKTGCPWSAVNFILALNQWMTWIHQCAPPDVRSPNPVQGYADDMQVSSRQEEVITNMLARTDEFLQWSGLEVKQAKCAVLHERRSGGNRWYKAKSDKPPTFHVMGQPIRVYSRNETYPYLGHRFNIAGEWGEQVEELTTEFLRRLHLVDLSPLPVLMKLQAVREVALAKIQHLFANVHLPLKALREMTDKTVQLVRKWVGLNTHSTRSIIFLPCREGGLGVPNVEWTYTATRLAHLHHMLNNDDVTVREMARASLLLDLRRRKVPLATADQNNFLGFRRKDSGKLDTQARGFGVWSDWPDLNDLCNRTGVQLKWTKPNTPTEVPVTDELVTDPSVVVEATITTQQGEVVGLTRDSARRVLLSVRQSETRQHWCGLRLQGKLACMESADHSVSHSVFKNAAVGEDVLTFTIKARLQVLPTKYNLSTWYPHTHNPFCLNHPDSQQHLESIAHITNGCHAYKHLYIARHDRIVDIVSDAVHNTVPSSAAMYKHTRVLPQWFGYASDIFANIPNTPDVVFVDTSHKEVLILEVGCTFDLYMDLAFRDKYLKYQPLLEVISSLGFKYRYCVLIFGSLGHVYKCTMRGLNIAGLSKRKAKQTAKYCSVSATIGSLAVWRRRCYVYP